MVNSKGLLLRILGFAPENGRSRYIRDLGIKCFCPSEDVLPNQVRPYDVGDVVCVAVLEVKKENRRFVDFKIYLDYRRAIATQTHKYFETFFIYR